MTGKMGDDPFANDLFDLSDGWALDASTHDALSDLVANLAGSGPYHLDGIVCDQSLDNFTACSEPTCLWSKPTTLTNCVVASYIAANLSTAEPEVVQGAAFVNINGSTPAFSDLAGNIATCLSSYCAIGNVCEDNGPSCSKSSLSGSGLTNATALQDCFAEICAPPLQQIDPDLAGIGVPTSTPIHIQSLTSPRSSLPIFFRLVSPWLELLL
jgi:hypothetical protein